jgi:hypothetical protein
MFIKILIITIVMLSLAFLGMMFNILVRKQGKFPEYRVGHNRQMAKKGIKCVKHEEIRCHRERLKQAEGCAGCA